MPVVQCLFVTMKHKERRGNSLVRELSIYCKTHFDNVVIRNISLENQFLHLGSVECFLVKFINIICIGVDVLKPSPVSTAVHIDKTH